MSRYIDADKLQESFKELHGGKRSLLIDTQPTADVVEVVRCKNCKYRVVGRDVSDPNKPWCERCRMPLDNDDGYCIKEILEADPPNQNRDEMMIATIVNEFGGKKHG